MSLFKAFLDSPVEVASRAIGWSKSRGFKKKHICVACFPKSGSTYLTRTLQEILDYKFIHYAHLSDNEHDILEQKLIDNLHVNTVTHLHITASRPNLYYLHYYNVKTIVQTRNIYDCIVSMREHILNETPIWPMAVVSNDFFEWTEAKQYDFIIATFIPWYIKFYVSWYQAYKDKKLPIFWVRYEELMKDKTAIICTLLEYHKITFDEQELISIISKQKAEKGKYRYNKGISGRGDQKLNVTQKNIIKRYTDYYPLVDFSAIGL